MKLVKGLLISALSLWSTELFALPGTHAPAISTFDTRASSVVLAYRSGVGEGTSRVFSYSANFTSTTGNFSAQFGAHFLQLRDEPGVKLLQGAAASGVGLFSLPLTDRFNNGVPKVALNFYLGVVPSAAVSGPRNFFTAPLTLGTGLTVSPTRSWSITPWAELAPSVNLDTYVAPFKLVPDEFSGATSIEELLNEQGGAEFEEPDVNEIIGEAVDLRITLRVAPRFGLQSMVHLGDTWDFNLDASVTSFGAWLAGTRVVYAGVGLAARWDDVSPEVLPAHLRLAGESCEAIEARYRMCPAGRRAGHQPAQSTAPLPAPAPSFTAPVQETSRARPLPAAEEPAPQVVPQPGAASEPPPLKAGKPPVRASPY